MLRCEDRSALAEILLQRAKPSFQCHWVGQGYCDENVCDSNDFEVDTSTWGDNNEYCRLHRKKSLCCDSFPEKPPAPNPSPSQEPIPTSETTTVSNPVPPVELDGLFLGNPASTSTWKEEFKFLDGKPDNSDRKTASAFGWDIIDGPNTAVASLKTKRDNSPSDLRFLECKSDGENIKARFVCTSNTPDLDCFEMLDGGLAGTVLELPNLSDDQKYAVARALRIAVDQSLPSELDNLTNSTVLELTLSHDHNLIKRDEGDVFFRIDFATAPGYWEKIVELGLAHTKEAWRTAMADWLRSLAPTDGTLLSGVLPEGMKLLSDRVDCAGSSAFVDLAISGAVTATPRIGMTMTGRLSPQFVVDEAYSVMDSSFNVHLNLSSSIAGTLKVPETTQVKLLEPFVLGPAFVSNLVLVYIAPRLEASMSFRADIDVFANFTTSWDVSTKDNIVQSWPVTMLDALGQMQQTKTDGSFDGFVQSFDREGSMTWDITPQLTLGTWLRSRQGSDAAKFVVVEKALVDEMMYVEDIIMFTTSNSLITTETDDQNWVNFINTTDARGLAQNGAAINVPGYPSGAESSGPATGVEVLRGGTLGQGTGIGPLGHDINYGTSGALALAAAGSLTCTAQGGGCSQRDPSCSYDICAADPMQYLDSDSLNSDDDITQIAEDIHQKSRRVFPVSLVGSTPTNKGIVKLRSQDYPSIGTIHEGDMGHTVLQSVLDYAADNDCSSIDVAQLPRVKPNSAYVTEHILELETIALFIEAANSGTLPSITGATLPKKFPYSFWKKDWEGDSLPAGLPVLNFTHKDSPQRSLNDRVFYALGAANHRKNFVICSKELNTIKTQLWQGNAPRRLAKFNLAVNEWLGCKPGAKPAAFMKYLKATRAVFSYLDGDNEVSVRFWNQVDLVRTELGHLEASVRDASGLTNAWDIYIQ